MFDNSKEFTRLGTLSKENRIAEYYYPDSTTQPKSLPAEIEQMLLRGDGKQNFI